jgi:5'-methylthioadenosine phosphorylase
MQRIGLIGGTGFGEALVAGSPERVETEYGPAMITRGPLDSERELIFVARHGAGHQIPPHRINHRANITALRRMGVIGVFATAAVGSLQPALRPGDFVVLDDFLDLTKGEVTFFDAEGHMRHTDMSQPYSHTLRQALLSTVGDMGDATVHSGGTYVCLSGPRYETPGEIRLFASWGGSVVGMTGAPEAILCREADLPYAGVSIVTNYGCGLVEPAALSHAEVEEQMARSRDQLAAWLLRAAKSVPSQSKVE